MLISKDLISDESSNLSLIWRVATSTIKSNKSFYESISIEDFARELIEKCYEIDIKVSGFLIYGMAVAQKQKVIFLSNDAENILRKKIQKIFNKKTISRKNKKSAPKKVAVRNNFGSSGISLSFSSQLSAMPATAETALNLEAPEISIENLEIEVPEFEEFQFDEIEIGEFVPENTANIYEKRTENVEKRPRKPKTPQIFDKKTEISKEKIKKLISQKNDKKFFEIPIFDFTDQIDPKKVDLLQKVLSVEKIDFNQILTLTTFQENLETEQIRARNEMNEFSVEISDFVPEILEPEISELSEKIFENEIEINSFIFDKKPDFLADFSWKIYNLIFKKWIEKNEKINFLDIFSEKNKKIAAKFFLEILILKNLKILEIEEIGDNLYLTPLLF